MPANPDHSADEPTEEMIRAGVRAMEGEAVYKCVSDAGIAIMEDNVRSAYIAMRAARPEAQAAPKLTEEQIAAAGPVRPVLTLVGRLRDAAELATPERVRENLCNEAACRIEYLEQKLSETLKLARKWRDAHSRELNALRQELKGREPTMADWENFG